MWKTAIGALLAIVAPWLAKKGIFVPAEFAGYISALVVFVTGLVSDGIKLGFQDTRTTIAGLVGAGAVALSTFGLDIDLETQTAIIGVAVFVIGLFTRSGEEAE